MMSKLIITFYLKRRKGWRVVGGWINVLFFGWNRRHDFPFQSKNRTGFEFQWWMISRKLMTNTTTIHKLMLFYQKVFFFFFEKRNFFHNWKIIPSIPWSWKHIFTTKAIITRTELEYWQKQSKSVILQKKRQKS